MNSLGPHNNLERWAGQLWWPCFTEKDFKVKRGEVTCPETHSKSVEWPGFEPRATCLQCCALFPSHCPESETSLPHKGCKWPCQHWFTGPRVQNKASLIAGGFNWSLKDGWDLERCTWGREKIHGVGEVGEHRLMSIATIIIITVI